MLRGHVITSLIYIGWGRGGDTGTALPMTVPRVSEVCPEGQAWKSLGGKVPMEVAFSQEEAGVKEPGL